MRTILAKQEMPAEVELEKLIVPASGSISRAMLLDNESLFAFRSQLIGQLSTGDPAQNGFAKAVCEFVEGISKESSVRRKYLRLVADFAIQVCSDVIRSENNDESDGANLALGLGRYGLPDQIAADWIDRTITLQNQTDANMAMANIVPLWLNDLGAIARHEKILV